LFAALGVDGGLWIVFQLSRRRIMCLQQQQKVFGCNEMADPGPWMDRNKEAAGETDTMSFCWFPMDVTVREVS
jgi:hypothetical protein